MASPVRHYKISPTVDDYDVHLTLGWAGRFFDLIPKRNRLKRPANRLTADLRAISISASWPRLMCGSIKKFYEGWLERKESPETPMVIAGTIRRLVTRIQSRVDNETLSIIRGAGVEINMQADTISRQRLELPMSVVWDHFMQENSFRYGIWGTQRNCFVSAFGAYEGFLLNTIRIALKQPTYKKPGGDGFVSVMSQFFGQRLAEHCWTESGIKAARYVRNSILHNAGDELSELHQLMHRYELVEKEIQILADDNIHLLRMIEDRAWKIAETAITMPQFAPKPRE